MGKPNKKTEKNIGKGKVTEVQVAFIVDRFLSDNNFHQARSAFRLEASALLSKSRVEEAPKRLLSLGEMLNEYVCLKEQKVMLEQENIRWEHEKSRVQILLESMQAAMNAYNAGGTTPMLAIPASSTPVSTSRAGCLPYQTPLVAPGSLPSENIGVIGSISSATTSKRKGTYNVIDAQHVAKRRCSSLNSGISSNAGVASNPQISHATNNKESSLPASAIVSPPYAYESNGLVNHGSSVAKCLFNRTVPSPPSTLPRTSSPSAKCISVPGTVISSETVIVSPSKQGTIYSVQKNRIITSSPLETNMKRTNSRDHVKGKLNSDSSDPPAGSVRGVKEASFSESDKEVDTFNIDFPSLDGLGPELLSELLNMGCDGIDFTELPDIDSSDNISGSSNDSRDCDNGASQVRSSHLSNATKVVTENGSMKEGPDALTSMNAMTKRVQILSTEEKVRNCSQRDPLP